MTAKTTPHTVDAIVIGAGFGGIYAVHKLHNEIGLTTVGFDKAEGPGRHLVLEPLPGRPLRHREPPLPLLLRPRPAAGQHVEAHVHHPA